MKTSKKKEKGTIKHQDREWPYWKGTRLDPSLATYRLPAHDFSRRPLQPAGGGTPEPGKADLAKQDASVTAHGI